MSNETPEMRAPLCIECASHARLRHWDHLRAVYEAPQALNDAVRAAAGLTDTALGACVLAVRMLEATGHRDAPTMGATVRLLAETTRELHELSRRPQDENANRRASLLAQQAHDDPEYQIARYGSGAPAPCHVCGCRLCRPSNEGAAR